MRNQVNVGQRGGLAKAEVSALAVASQQGLEGIKTIADPGGTLRVDGRLVALELLVQVFQNPAVVDRMDVTADDGG